jgi:hypothetical protein
MLRLLGLSLLLLFCACGTTRKISQVGLREPSSDSNAVVISDLRNRISQTEKLAANCPKGTEYFSALASERVIFPTCPSPLVENFQHALNYLKMEERTTIEEAITSQCRSLSNAQYGESLESLVANFESTGPLGRRAAITHTLRSTEAETKILLGLKKGLEELVYQNLPVDRWVEVNGDFLIPERDLSQLDRLLVTQSCRLGDQDLEESYQMTRSLEELARVLKEGEQRSRLENFLGGVHRIIDEKIQEFFYPNR